MCFNLSARVMIFGDYPSKSSDPEEKICVDLIDLPSDQLVTTEDGEILESSDPIFYSTFLTTRNSFLLVKILSNTLRTAYVRCMFLKSYFEMF